MRNGAGVLSCYDSCFVEQKNYSVMRRAVGYARYDTADQLRVLNELYSYLRLPPLIFPRLAAVLSSVFCKRVM